MLHCAAAPAFNPEASPPYARAPPCRLRTQDLPRDPGAPTWAAVKTTWHRPNRAPNARPISESRNDPTAQKTAAPAHQKTKGGLAPCQQVSFPPRSHGFCLLPPGCRPPAAAFLHARLRGQRRQQTETQKCGDRSNATEHIQSGRIVPRSTPRTADVRKKNRTKQACVVPCSVPSSVPVSFSAERPGGGCWPSALRHSRRRQGYCPAPGVAKRN